MTEHEGMEFRDGQWWKVRRLADEAAPANAQKLRQRDARGRVVKGVSRGRNKPVKPSGRRYSGVLYP